jgi:hypothetical protein
MREKKEIWMWGRRRSKRRRRSR